MNVEELRDYCLLKNGVTEEFPFDEVTLVFKVKGKMFALIGLDSVEQWVNLKCNPDLAIELRERYPGDVLPGYHMNKKHWNTVNFAGSLTDNYVKELVDHSYNLVVATLPKTEKQGL